ncbi:MAG: methyltransferase domain-containing protein [Alphaproteobacteria bacterium]|nr:methyltransferase domain-containing protein [Alphaproteobacteria bacterium]
MTEYDHNFLLNRKVKIYQPCGMYHASTDAVWLAASVNRVRKGDRILDVGSGTGAVSLCLAHRLQDKDVKITGVDIQPDLVRAANLSAEANNFSEVSFACIDVLHERYAHCSFNHVVTNPPYYDKSMISPNSSKALAHSFESADLHGWIDFCIKALKPQGRFYMINRAAALSDIISALAGRLWGIEIFPLFSKPDETQAKRVIIRATKDCKTPPLIRAPLYVHTSDGGHTPLAEAVLRAGAGLD